MYLYQLQRKQVLPISLEEAWDFFSSPKNLEKITPKDMAFEIKRIPEGKMYAGMVVEYVVRPIFGIPIGWVTEITHVEEPKYFVDEQRFGPYALWHHQHHFKEVEGGVEMIDLVHHKNPLGFLGGIANWIFVEKRLNQIFDYRYEILEKYFAKK